jgi:hypothetical protein
MTEEKSPVQSPSKWRRLGRRFLDMDRRIALAVAALLTFTGIASAPGTVATEWMKTRVLGASRAVSDAGVRIIFPGTSTSTSTTANTGAADARTPLSTLGAIPGGTVEPQAGRRITTFPAPGPTGSVLPAGSSTAVPFATPTAGVSTASPLAGTPTQRPTVTAPPQMSDGFRVVEVFLRADPFDYTGACPVTIRFSGRISVAGGGGTVSFKFLRSDGASAPVQTLKFDGPGSKDVTETWQIGGAGSSYNGWEAIQIFDPNDMQSEHATFTIRCGAH